MTNMVVFDQKQQMAAACFLSHSASKKEDMLVNKQEEKQSLKYN